MPTGRAVSEMTTFEKSLVRDRKYVFVFGNGIDAIKGTFHGSASDGCLDVTDDNDSSYRINPDNVIYTRSID